MKPFIAYYRVSTQRQGVSGLGLEAQQETVTRHILQQTGQLVAAYQEIESGKHNDRPQLLKAIAHAKRARATLIVAKIDRLSRNAVFLLTLQESGLPLVFCDLPGANEFTVGIMALVAQQERKLISIRTKEALQAFKARGGVLGGLRPAGMTKKNGWRPAAKPLSPEAWAVGQRRGAVATQRKAAEAYTDLVPLMQELRGRGETFAYIADHLNILGHGTRTGRNWSKAQVRRVLGRTVRVDADNDGLLGRADRRIARHEVDSRS